MAKQLPTFQTQYARTLVQVFADSGLNIHELLEQCGLPADMFTQDSNYVPPKPIKQLLQLVSDELGAKKLATLLRGTLKQHIVPKVLPSFAECATLKEALLLVNEVFTRDTPGSKVHFKQEHNQYWFCRYPILGERRDFHLQEMFILVYMVELISALTDQEWQPHKIKLVGKELGILPEIFPAHCQYFIEQQCTATLINDKELALPIILEPSIASSDSQDNEWHSSFTDTLFELLLPFIREKNLTIEDVAELMDMSVRSLQRKLKQEQTSFRQLKDSLMFTVACDMMAQAHSITYIANQLGYADISHFSRAFKRASGLTPKAYQRGLSG
ncbi:helix-turn-helix domain-containing protein [Shewanella maritima]|uniref:helix-turn-helix domain-containing protein n=1 Tax=Shewanella maritima TaxID=2520507 RepID=UPI003735F06E